MASYTIELDKAEVEWLETLMQQGVDKAARFVGGWADHIEKLLAIQKALSNKTVVRTESTQRAPRRSSEDIQAERKQALCKDHPLRTLKKRPTDDCKTCWAQYKRLEPMKYPKAWRDFKAAQRKKAGK